MFSVVPRSDMWRASAALGPSSLIQSLTLLFMHPIFPAIQKENCEVKENEKAK